MNRNILIIAVVLVVLLGAFFFFRGGNQLSTELDTEVPESRVPAPGYEEVSETIVSPNGTEEPLEVEKERLVEEISIVSGNLFFSPRTLTLSKGQPIRINFQNTGSHTFTINELGVNTTLRGSSATVEFTPNKSGTFEYYCAVPGHREGGMFGTLTVE